MKEAEKKRRMEELEILSITRNERKRSILIEEEDECCDDGYNEDSCDYEEECEERECEYNECMSL
jgi:hypothetical protein